MASAHASNATSVHSGGNAGNICTAVAPINNAIAAAGRNRSFIGIRGTTPLFVIPAKAGIQLFDRPEAGFQLSLE